MSPATHSDAQADNDAPVRSLERGLAVLRCFDRPPAELTLSEVATRTHMSPAAARRYLHTLERLGYLAESARRFRPTARVLELAFPYFAASGLTRAVEAEIARLAEQTNESCALTVLDHHDVINVFCVNSPEGLSIQLRVGRRLPTYCTAMGRALLTGFSDDKLRQHLSGLTRPRYTDYTVRDIEALVELVDGVRSSGYAVGDQEYENGVRSIAMPVRDGSNRVVAAASVSTPTARVPTDILLGSVRAELTHTVDSMQTHLQSSVHTNLR